MLGLLSTQLRASITENGGKMICDIIYKICNICDKCSFALAILRKKTGILF